MFSKKYLAILLCSLLVVSFDAPGKKKNKAPACGNDEVACKDMKNPCKCYCAFKGAPRDKTPDDDPIFIEDDPEGNYCYCKERDIKEMNRKRALLGKPAIKY